MSIYDIVMLAVIGGSVFFGFWKGLAWQIASLAAIIVSYLVAINFRGPVAQFIKAEEPWDNIGAMLILFVGTSMVVWIIYSRVSKTIKSMELKGFDRQAGALLGAFKGILLCMVFTVLSVSWLGEGAHDTIHNSKLGPYVVSGIGAVSAVVPDEIAQIIDPHVDEFEKALGHDINQPPEEYDQGGSRYSIGKGLFRQNQDENSPNDSPSFLRGQLHWETSASPNSSSTQFDNQQTGYQSGVTQGVPNWGTHQQASGDSTSRPATTQDFVNSASDGLFKHIAEATKSAFESPSQRK